MPPEQANQIPPAADLDARFDAAREWARRAAQGTMSLFRSDRLRVDSKTDRTPVTEADRQAEADLRGWIGAQFPQDGVLGEELGEKPGTSGWRWILDPIDGTRSFVHGVPLFGTMVGVEFAGRCVAGVIELPALGERLYGAEGQGAWHDAPGRAGTRARVSGTPDLADAMVCTTAMEYFDRGGCPGLYERLYRSVGCLRGWSDCYAFVLLATGRIDAVVEPLVKPWDLGAMVPILAEAGGRMTDFAGGARIDSGQSVLSNGRLHDALLRVVSAG